MSAVVDWVPVCSPESVAPESGVAALVKDQQLAIFRTWDEEYFTVGNQDPFSKTNIMSRGIVGTRGDIKTVASPMFKQAFDLNTGKCLDDATKSLGSWPTRIQDGQVEVLL